MGPIPPNRTHVSRRSGCGIAQAVRDENAILGQPRITVVREEVQPIGELEREPLIDDVIRFRNLATIVF